MRQVKSPIWTRWFIGLGILLILGSGGMFAAERALVVSVNHAVRQEDLLGSARRVGAVHRADVKGAKNILLVGLDTRPSWAKTGELSRSDSIILMHIPADHSSAYLISFPRDALVTIPAYNNGKVPYRGGHDKINAAFAYGSRGLTGQAAESHGFELLALTIKKLSGITPDAAAIIDFSGFTRVLRILGTVCMYVDETVTSIHVGHRRNGNQARPYMTDSAGQNPRPVRGVVPNVYRKGDHCFTPVEALDYARQRDLLADGDGDYGRQRHQQQLLKAIFGTAVHEGLTSPTKLPGLLTAIGRTMTVDDGGISVQDWAFAMRGLRPADIVTLKTNEGKFNSRTIRGVGSVEILSPASREMIQAVRDDTLAAFVQAHPTWQAHS